MSHAPQPVFDYEAAVSNISAWLAEQMTHFPMSQWPSSCIYWFTEVDLNSSESTPAPSIIGFFSDVLAWTGSAQVAPLVDSNCTAVDRGMGLIEQVGSPPQTPALPSRAVTWYVNRLSAVDESAWTDEMKTWSAGPTTGPHRGDTELSTAPPSVVGWLGEVLIDTELPSSQFQTIGEWMKAQVDGQAVGSLRSV